MRVGNTGNSGASGHGLRFLGIHVGQANARLHRLRGPLEGGYHSPASPLGAQKSTTDWMPLRGQGNLRDLVQAPQLQHPAEVVLLSGTFGPNIHEHRVRWQQQRVLVQAPPDLVRKPVRIDIGDQNPSGYLMTYEKAVGLAPRAPPIALCKPAHDFRGSGRGMSRDLNLLLIAQRDEKESTSFVKPGQMEYQTLQIPLSWTRKSSLF